MKIEKKNETRKELWDIGEIDPGVVFEYRAVFYMKMHHAQPVGNAVDLVTGTPRNFRAGEEAFSVTGKFIWED